MNIEKKCWPVYFDDVLQGKKRFELRLGDTKYQVGDVLTLREWDPIISKYTGRVINKKITGILKTKDLDFWSQKEIEKHGFQILSLED